MNSTEDNLKVLLSGGDLPYRHSTILITYFHKDFNHAEKGIALLINSTADDTQVYGNAILSFPALKSSIWEPIGMPMRIFEG